MSLQIPKWNVTEVTGYKPFTTFWMDFSIADNYGVAAVKDTFRRAFAEWKSDYKYLTEMVLVLNHKIWQHYESNKALAVVYDELCRTADGYACDNLKGEQLAYFYQTTD